MQTWDIFLTLSAVVGLFATVLPFFTKLNRTLGELNATVEQMKTVISNFERNSRETHKNLYEKWEDHEARLSCVETRLMDKPHRRNEG